MRHALKDLPCHFFDLCGYTRDEYGRYAGLATDFAPSVVSGQPYGRDRPNQDARTASTDKAKTQPMVPARRASPAVPTAVLRGCNALNELALRSLNGGA